MMETKKETEAFIVNNGGKKKVRYFGYDLIKTIAIYCIVIYHFRGVDFGFIDEWGGIK